MSIGGIYWYWVMIVLIMVQYDVFILLTLLGMLDQVTLHIEGFPALGAVVCFGVVMGLHVSS